MIRYVSCSYQRVCPIPIKSLESVNEMLDVDEEEMNMVVLPSQSAAMLDGSGPDGTWIISKLNQVVVGMGVVRWYRWKPLDNFPHNLLYFHLSW